MTRVYTKSKKEIEYEDAPSGYVTMYNYKEPFMKFEEGYGYQGVLLFDGDSDKVQCHFCGEWFVQLAPHLAREHNMRVAAYKSDVGLAQTTALIGEKMREKLIASGLDKRLQNLRAGGKQTTETKEKIRATLKRNVTEYQNMRGTCPLQLIDKLRRKYAELGRTPTLAELPGITTIIKVYGSMKEACEIAGIPYRAPSQTLKNQLGLTKWGFESCVAAVRIFIEEHDRLPKPLELGSGMNTAIRERHGREKVYKAALMGDGKYRKVGNIFRLSKEELIELLQKFESVHGRKPSYSDAKRGMLPVLSRYSYHFGSWKNALSLAFPK